MANNRFSGRPSNLGPDPNGDPLAVNQTNLKRGAIWNEPPHALRERGRITSVDVSRHAYRVVTLGGRTLTCLRILDSPQDYQLLPIGTDVRIDWSLGAPYIDGVLPSEVDLPQQSSVDNPTGTSGFSVNDPVLDTNYGANGRNPNMPTDILPGDFLRQSPDGASIGALTGKTALLHGGHLAQFMLFGNEDKAELIAGVLRIITWMGESKVVNEGGRTSFIWRGGANQLSETGSDEEKYTIHLDVGATGNLVNFKITTTDQQTLFQAHITSDGRIEIFSIAGLDATFNNQSSVGHQQRFAGDISRQIQGSVTEQISGNRTHSVDADAIEELFNNSIQHIGNDLSTQVNRNIEISAGGSSSRRIVENDEKTVGGEVKTTVQGNHTTTSVNAKIQLTCQSDDLEVDTGSHVAKFTCTAMEVAGNTNYAVLYNQLQQLLTEFLTNYIKHVHPTSTGPSGPPVPDSAVSLLSDVPSLQSQRLKLGG